jgi:cytosine/creatinine deaminase
MIAGATARLMRLEDYSIAVSGPADLVCLDASNPADAIATLAQPLWASSAAESPYTRSRQQLHPPDSA